MDVLVAGAGIVGLTAALRLRQAGHRVRVVARERTPRTTSDIAAAVWYPFRCGTDPRVVAWAVRTREVLRGLAAVPEAAVTWLPGVEVQDAGAPAPWWAPWVEGTRPALPGELPPGVAAGVAFEAPVVRMPAHLSWLEQELLAAEVGIEEREVRSLDTLLEEAPVVVNATGLGARALTGDPELHPIRGQIVRVAPGGVSRFLQDDARGGALAYVIPRPDCTVLGGTADDGAWDLTPDPATAEAILTRCLALEPGLAGRAVLSHAVGLRPGRSSVRLQAERFPGGTVVHAYGHGGAGLTLSWGCAESVVAEVALAAG